MTRPVLVLRPQPGADATAARAVALGLRPFVAPLFRIATRAWSLPDTPFDGLLLTSANAARALDERLDRCLKVYAVGSPTADAARAAGFGDVEAGEADVAWLIRRAAADGVRSLLHLAGKDRTAFDPGELRIDTRVVYTAEPSEPSPEMADALAEEAVALLHSARAARRFRELAGTGHRIAAISSAVGEAAGLGWAGVAVAERPTDDALLEAAARLCH